MRARLLADPRNLTGRRRLPLRALPGDDALDVHGVELLDGAALALDDEEVDQEPAEDVAAREDVAVAEVDRGHDEWCEEGEEEIPEPVRGGGEGHTLRAVAGGV